MAKYTYTPDRFPADKGWLDANDLLGYGRLYDGNGQALTPFVVAYNDETGEVWSQVQTNGKPDIVDGEVLLAYEIHKPPLTFKPLRAKTVKVMTTEPDQFASRYGGVGQLTEMTPEQWEEHCKKAQTQKARKLYTIMEPQMWIQTDYDFGYPYKNFTVSIREIAQARQVKEILMTHQNDPNEIERLIQAMIEFYRPSLKGGVVCGIVMRGGLLFTISYAHPSLPRVLLQNMPETEPLIPTDEGGMEKAGGIFVAE